MAAGDDAAAIAAVLLESFAEYRSLYTEPGFAATTSTRELILERLSEGPGWVALHGEMIIGAVSVAVKGQALYIRGMAVSPSARGHRVGELLLRQIEEFASESGLKRLLLSTTPFLHRAIRLYEKNGFASTSEGPNELFGTPLFTMEKLLEAK